MGRKQICLSLITFSLITLLFINCTNPPDNDEKVMARVENNYKITFADLHKFVNEAYYHRRYRTTSEAFRHALNDMITEQLKSIDFFEKKFHQDPQIMQELRRTINEELLVLYFEKEYLGRYTSENFAKKIYDRMDKEVSYQKITITKPDQATEEKLKELQSLAMEIKTKIDNDENLLELTREYSDKGLILKFNANLPPLTWENSLSSQLNNIIFNLNNGDSQVLDNGKTFVIIKVTHVKEIVIEPFEKIKDKLIKKLKESYYYQSLTEFDQDKFSLIDTQQVIWNDESLMQLVTWSNLPQFYAGAYRDTLAKAISMGNNFTILKYQENPIRLEDYLRLLNEILILDANAKNLNSTKIKQFIIDALQSKEIIQKAKDQGLEEKIFHPFTQNSILKMKLVDLYDQEMIKSKIPNPTETDLKKFYQENEIKLYFHPEKINLYLMFYSDKSEAEKVLDKINAGTSFEEISNHWFVKTYIKNRQGEIQPHFGEEPMIFEKIGFELAQSEVADVLEYDDPEKGLQYVIIKCARRTPAKQLTYEEAGKTIAEDYKKYYRDKIRETVKNKLWERYDVYINEAYLTEIINKIDAKLSAATS